MPTAARLTLRQELAQRLYGSESFLTGAATAAGSTSTLVDSGLVSTAAGSNRFQSYWLFIDSFAASAAPEGEARMVSQYDPATGTLTVDPAFTAAPSSVSSATYELHPVLHPDRLTEAANWSLEFGSNNTYAAITDDDLTTSAVYDKEVLIEGALYYVKEGWALQPDLSPERRIELLKQSQDHYETWERMLDTLIGYRLPVLTERSA